MINAGYVIHKMSQNRSALDKLEGLEDVPEFYGQSVKGSESSATLCFAVSSDDVITTLNEFFEYKSLKKWKENLY